MERNPTTSRYWRVNGRRVVANWSKPIIRELHGDDPIEYARFWRERIAEQVECGYLVYDGPNAAESDILAALA